MPDQAKHHAGKRSKSQPGRYYHLKRLAAACAGLMVFLLVVRLWWGWEAHRRLQAEIDRIVARGEPLFPEDFNPAEEISDDQNAAILYTKAAKSLNLTAEQDAFVRGDRPPEKEWTEEHRQIIAGIPEASAEARELVRQGRTLPAVDWGLRLKSPAINILLPKLSDQRQLARVLGWAVRHFMIAPAITRPPSRLFATSWPWAKLSTKCRVSSAIWSPSRSRGSPCRG